MVLSEKSQYNAERSNGDTHMTMHHIGQTFHEPEQIHPKNGRVGHGNKRSYMENTTRNTLAAVKRNALPQRSP